MNVYAIDRLTHDMYILNGQIARVTDSDAILQTVKTRLLTVQEEWFMDLSAGLPYFTKIMGANPSLEKTRAYLASEIINTDGVDTLKSIDLDFDKANRKLNVTFEYIDIYGNTTQGVL